MPLTVKEQDEGGDDANRRQEEHLRFLRMVREWADGGDTPPLVPAGHDERVRKVLDDITHAARHERDATDREAAGGNVLTTGYHRGREHAYRDVVRRLTQALR